MADGWSESSKKGGWEKKESAAEFEILYERNKFETTLFSLILSRAVFFLRQGNWRDLAVAKKGPTGGGWGSSSS